MRACGHTRSVWVCVADEGHDEDRHYFVLAYPDGLAPLGEQLGLM